MDESFYDYFGLLAEPPQAHTASNQFEMCNSWTCILAPLPSPTTILLVLPLAQSTKSGQWTLVENSSLIWQPPTTVTTKPNQISPCFVQLENLATSSQLKTILKKRCALIFLPLKPFWLCLLLYLGPRSPMEASLRLHVATFAGSPSFHLLYAYSWTRSQLSPASLAL